MRLKQAFRFCFSPSLLFEPQPDGRTRAARSIDQVPSLPSKVGGARVTIPGNKRVYFYLHYLLHYPYVPTLLGTCLYARRISESTPPVHRTFMNLPGHGVSSLGSRPADRAAAPYKGR